MLVFLVLLAFVVLLRFRAWFHLGSFLWMQYCCMYLQFFYTQLLVSILLVLSFIIFISSLLLLFFRVRTAFLISDDVNSVDIGVANTFYTGVASVQQISSKYFAMISDCFFSFEVSPPFVLIINFSLGVSRLIFLTASNIFIVSFSFLSKSCKAYLILSFYLIFLYFFSFLMMLWIWVIILFLSFFSNFFFSSSLMEFNLTLISFWIDERCRIFGSLLFISLWL